MKILGGRRLSELHPSLYAVAVACYCSRRWLRWQLEDAIGSATASASDPQPLPARIKRHQSRLIRPLGDTPQWMQHNKVINLRRALPCVDGLVVRPGERFSFWRCIGRPTRRRGYVDGMQLSRGVAISGVGGGLCQLASVIHWLVMHSPLLVTERSVHSFDLFPDHERSIPWGTGCAVFYNYVDLAFLNPTDRTFQLRLQLTDRFLDAELRADTALPWSYSIVERAAAFERVDGVVYRRNELWRRVFDRRTGALVREELVRRNRARVAYPVEPDSISE